jgi:hypothetical protein
MHDDPKREDGQNPGEPDQSDRYHGRPGGRASRGPLTDRNGKACDDDSERSDVNMQIAEEILGGYQCKMSDPKVFAPASGRLR